MHYATVWVGQLMSYWWLVAVLHPCFHLLLPFFLLLFVLVLVLVLPARAVD